MTDAAYMRAYRAGNPEYRARLKKLARARAEAAATLVRRHQGEYTKILFEIKKREGLL